MPATQTAILRLPTSFVGAAGILLCAIPAAYLAMSFLRRAPVRLGYWQIEVPLPTVAISQIT